MTQLGAIASTLAPQRRRLSVSAISKESAARPFEIYMHLMHNSVMDRLPADTPFAFINAFRARARARARSVSG